MSLHNTIFKLSNVGRGKKQPLEVFCKKGVLKNFTNFAGKTPAFELLFYKVVGLRPVTLLKRDSSTGVFPVKFAKFLRTPILKNSPKCASGYGQKIMKQLKEAVVSKFSTWVFSNVSEIYLIYLKAIISRDFNTHTHAHTHTHTHTHTQINKQTK